MKKYLAILASMIFVLGFAATAFAVHAEIPEGTSAVSTKGETQMTIGGDIRFRGWSESNTKDFNSDIKSDGDNNMYDTRLRLYFDAKVAPNVTGKISIESNSASDGDTYTWGGSSADGAKGTYAVGNKKQNGLNVLEAWVLYKNDFAGLKVGHMPLFLGDKLFFDHSKFGDDAIVVFFDPSKQLHIGVLTAKFKEGSNWLSDDADAYVALAYYTADALKAGIDITYVDDQSFPTLAANTHLMNVGVRGSAKLGPVGVKADIEWQNGKIKADNGLGNDVKLTGYAALVGADISAGPAKILAEFAYGSGDKTDSADKMEGFITSLGNDLHYAVVYDYRVRGAGGASLMGLTNTMYARLGASLPIGSEMTIGLDYFYLHANQVASGVSKSLGNEIDVKFNWKFAKNLNYFINSGYLLTGDFYKNGVATANVDNVYVFQHGIMLSF